MRFVLFASFPSSVSLCMLSLLLPYYARMYGNSNAYTRLITNLIFLLTNKTKSPYMPFGWKSSACIGTIPIWITSTFLKVSVHLICGHLSTCNEKFIGPLRTTTAAAATAMKELFLLFISYLANRQLSPVVTLMAVRWDVSCFQPFHAKRVLAKQQKKCALL